MKQHKCQLLLFLGIFLFSFFHSSIFYGTSEDAPEKNPKPSFAKGLPKTEFKISNPIPKPMGEEIPDWKARWELAKILGYVKRYDESIIEYKKLLQEKPDLFEARAEMANVFFWQGRNDEALKELEQIPSKNIDEKTKVLMADIYVTQKKYGKAEPLYRVYLQMHPEDHKVRLKFAEMLSWYKKYDASLAEYEKILEARPDDIQVRRKYAFVLIWAGRHAEATAELRKTLK